jgi:microcystin-dependent protein
MSNPFLGEIRIFAGNFAPTGWALCNGQLMSISQNTALFSLLGTTYGGDGKSNFALPNLQGCIPMQPGQGPGLSSHVPGESGGSPTVTLIQSQMPAHSHTAKCDSGAGSLASPANGVWAASGAGRTPPPYYSNATPTAQMSPNVLSSTGGSQPHNNMAPYLGLTFIIALQGIYPPRS